MTKRPFAILLASATLFVAQGRAIAQPQQPAPNQQSNGSASNKKDANANQPAPPSQTSSAQPSASAAPSTKPVAPPSKPESANPVTVWVNVDSHVYHLPGSHWYGKTKHGKYMTEADAIKAGYRPASKNH